MGITELSVKRPATIVIIIVLLLGLGIIGFTSMGSDLLPSLDFPIITVSTTYAGSGAEQIKKDIVKPIEDAVSGISGIDTLSSTSKDGYGNVIITFKMGTDMNTALMDVQKAVEGVSSKLPTDASKPMLLKLDPGATDILTLSVYGDNISYGELYNAADQIKTSVEKIPGVGNVTLIGGKKQRLNIRIDKTAMEYYNLSASTVLGLLKTSNVSIPAGKIKEESSNQAVRFMGEFEDINSVKNLLIPIGTTGSSIPLSQIAQIQMGYPDDTQLLRLDGKSAIGISIKKQSDANVVNAAKRVKEELLKIEAGLPESVKVTIANDGTTFINASLSEIERNLIEGIITTTIVLLLFLRSWRSSLIVLVAIPTSLVSTFFMMYVCGFTLNIMSLMGLSLCIGILVDDSIVILENIQRHLSMGKTPIQAAIEGRKEIGMAAIAITLCDVVVYLPVAFVGGISGQFLKEFGLTVAFASLFSLFVSFTITPMLSSRFLRGHEQKKAASTKPAGFLKQKLKLFSSAFDKVVHLYERFLVWSLKNRWKMIGITVAGIALSIALVPLHAIGTESIPTTDQGMIQVEVALSPGSTLAQTDAKAKEMEAYLKTIPEVVSYYSTVGTTSNPASTSITVRMKSKNERKRSQSEISNDVRTFAKTMTGVNVTVNESSMGMGGSSKPIVINLKGDDFEVLSEIAVRVEDILGSIPGVIEVSNSVRQRETEVQVRLDRIAADSYGVSGTDISTILRTAIQGSNAGVFRANGDENDIVVSFQDGQLKTISDIGSLKVASKSGKMISLNQVARIVQEDSMQDMSRADRQDVAKISANLQGTTLGEANEKIKAELEKLSLPYGYSITFGGSQQQMMEAFGQLGMALAAGILLVYMILVILYESFLTPIVRIMSLPCAIIGALVALAVTHQTINMLSLIGLIMLDGLASKNGTLLIDYTNTLMKDGLSLREALIKSGTTRIRPIIMTTATMVVGMLPAALSMGEGSEIKTGMAIVIIGGMISSTLLTPIILPIVYTLLDDLKNHVLRNKKQNLNQMEVYSHEA